MVNIKKQTKIDEETLNSEFYFKSLLEQGYLMGLLTDEELEKIQLDCISILAEQSKLYDSSSIPIETAQSLLDSIMFTMGVCLKAYPHADDALQAIKKEELAALYQKGNSRIYRMIKQAKHLHSVIVGNLFKTKNVFYAASVVDGINAFFKHYRPGFAAHEIHITADYPVFQSMERLLGIEFILKYLEFIYYENQFCAHFSDVHYLLCGYHEYYEELLFNIYEPILTVAIGCILTHESVERLALTPSSLQMLYDMFNEKSTDQIKKILEDAANQLNIELFSYPNLFQIAQSIKNAVLTKTLNRIFIIPKYPQNKLILSFGEKMDNIKYRKVLKKIIQCQNPVERNLFIKSEIHSLWDLDDIFLDANLCEKEVIDVLVELSSAEIAALVKTHPLNSTPNSYYEKALFTFVSTLPTEQQKLLKLAVKALYVADK